MSEDSAKTQEEWEKEWREKPPRFSCSPLNWSGYDYATGKSRIHFDAKRGYWRCGRGSRVLRCAGCGNEKIVPNNQRLCEECRQISRDVWYTPEYRKLQARAHAIVSKAVYVGALPQLDGSVACADCGKPARGYDHRDYSQSLIVEPVCSGCNKRRGPAIPSRTHLSKGLPSLIAPAASPEAIERFIAALKSANAPSESRASAL